MSGQPIAEDPVIAELALDGYGRERFSQPTIKGRRYRITVAGTVEFQWRDDDNGTRFHKRAADAVSITGELPRPTIGSGFECWSSERPVSRAADVLPSFSTEYAGLQLDGKALLKAASLVCADREHHEYVFEAAGTREKFGLALHPPWIGHKLSFSGRLRAEGSLTVTVNLLAQVDERKPTPPTAEQIRERKLRIYTAKVDDKKALIETTLSRAQEMIKNIGAMNWPAEEKDNHVDAINEWAQGMVKQILELDQDDEIEKTPAEYLG